jgi:DNA-binding LytR/AlgR family response regulator
LLKPISFERLLQAVNKYLGENISIKNDLTSEIKEEKNNFIFVRSDRKMIKINFSEINFIESLSDYIKIYLEDKIIVTRENNFKH